MRDFLQRLYFPFSIILFLFLCLFIYTKVAGPIPFAVNSIQTTKSDVFHVDGIGKISQAPDSAHISFGVTKTATTVADAQNQTNSAISSILDSLKKLGIAEKDMQTTNYSVSPNYNFQAGNQTITGYTVTQQINLKLSPIEKVNQALDTITKNGANLVGQVSFGFSDELQKKLEDKARQMAVQDAKDKAQSLANASGIHLGQIIDVTESASPQPPVIMPMAADAKDQGSAPTQITPGENTISTTVTLSYQTY